MSDSAADSKEDKPSEDSRLVRAKDEVEAEENIIKAEVASTYEAIPSFMSPEKPSLFAKVRDAKAAASGNVEYVARALPEVLYCGDICVGVSLLIIAAIHLVLIVFGSVYFHKCPRQPHVPLYLVVAGCAGILLICIPAAELIHRLCTESEDEDGVFMRVLKFGARVVIGERETKKSKIIKVTIICVESILALFIFAWFITGSVWTFGIHGDFSDDSNDDRYCNNVLYMFTFVVLLIQYALIALVLSWVVGLLCLGCCIASKMNS